MYTFKLILYPLAPTQVAVNYELKVYILWSEELQKFYVGSTNDMDEVHRHNSGYRKFTSKEDHGLWYVVSIQGGWFRNRIKKRK